MFKNKFVSFKNPPEKADFIFYLQKFKHILDSKKESEDAADLS